MELTATSRAGHGSALLKPTLDYSESHPLKDDENEGKPAVNGDEEEEDMEPLEISESTKRYGYILAAAMVVITFFSIPSTETGKSAHYVWWCGWLTAVATGLGALPFYFIRDVDKFWLGICNGLAAGMMLAATGCLFYEGWHIPQHADYGVSVGYRLFVGVFLGVMSYLGIVVKRGLRDDQSI